MPGNYNLGTAEGLIRLRYDGAGVAAKATDDVDKIGKSADKSSASLDRVGTRAGIAGALVAGAIGYAANKAIDFEKEISAVAAVSGASSSQLDALRKKALQLGADTQFSASEAAVALEELAKAGISLPDILNGAADAAVYLAAAGGVGLPEAATLAANAMNNFGISARDLNHVVDLIAGAANASAIDVSEFGQSLAQVGAVAHLAGLTFDDTAVAIAEMGNAGIKGSDAGTSLKTFLQNLIPTTKQQIALSKQLGLITKDNSNAFFDQHGKVKSLADISQILQTALKGQSKEQQLATLQTLFGSDAIRAASVLASNGAKGFDDLAAAMGKTSAADVAAQRMNNTAGQIEQLKGSVETAAIAFGELLLPTLTRVAKYLTSFANWLNGLSTGWKQVILGVSGSAAGFLALIFIMSKLVKAFETIKAFLAIVKSFELGAKLAAAATKIWAAAQWILNAAMAVGPVGLIVLAIAAIAAGVYLLWTRSAAFRKFFIALWNDIWSILKAIGGWFAGPFKDFFVSAFDAIRKPIAAFINFFMPLWRATFGLIADIVRTAFSVITAIFTVAFTVWWAIMKPIFKLITDAWNLLWNGVKLTVQAVWAIVGPLIESWLNRLKTGFDVMKSVLIVIWNTLWAVIQAVFNALVAWFKIQWDIFKAIVSGAWDFIVAVIRNGINIIVGIFDAFRSLLDKVRDFFDQLRNAASGGVGSLVAFVAGIPGRIWNAISPAFSMLYNAGRSIIQSLINGILSMVNEVKNAIGHVLSAARNLLPFSPAKEGPFSGKGWTLYSGQSIMEALADGILGRADAAVDAMRSTMARVGALAAGGNPLSAQFAYNGAAAASLAAPSVNVPQPQVTVIADLGNGVRQVVRSEVVNNPNLVSTTTRKGAQNTSWAAGK